MNDQKIIEDMFSMYCEACEGQRDPLTRAVERLAFYSGVTAGISMAQHIVQILGPQCHQVLAKRSEAAETLTKGIVYDIELDNEVPESSSDELL